MHGTYVILTFWGSGNYNCVGYETAKRAVAAFENAKNKYEGGRVKAMYLMTSDGPQIEWRAE